MKPLTQHQCVPCEGGAKPLTRVEFKQYLPEVNGWEVVRDEMLEQQFKFKNFAQALEFLNAVGEIAEAEGHHPDMLLYGWNKVKISLTTHAINGLSINDFILAAKINAISR